MQGDWMHAWLPKKRRLPRTGGFSGVLTELEQAVTEAAMSFKSHAAVTTRVFRTLGVPPLMDATHRIYMDGDRNTYIPAQRNN